MTSTRSRTAFRVSRVLPMFARSAPHENFPRNSQFEGKSYGILSVAGVLYMWVAPQPNPHLATAQIAVSRNHGASWTLSDWKFEFADELTIPTF